LTARLLGRGKTHSGIFLGMYSGWQSPITGLKAIMILYKDRIKKKWKIMTLDAMEFIRRFLQHVLPPGFMKVRHVGFLNPNSRISIEKISELITLIHDVIRDLLPEISSRKKKGFQCPHCGHNLRFLTFIKPIPIWCASG